MNKLIERISFGLFLSFILLQTVDRILPNLTNMAILAAGFTMVIYGLGSQFRVQRDQLLVLCCLICLLIVAVIVTTVAAFPTQHIQYLSTVVLFVLVPTTAVITIQNIQRLQITLITICITCSLIVLASIVASALGSPLVESFGNRTIPLIGIEVTRYSLIGGLSFGAFGTFYSLSLPFVLLTLAKPTVLFPRRRLIYVRGIAFSCLSILIYAHIRIYSRSTIIASFAIVGVLLYYSYSSVTKWANTIIGTLTLSIGVAALALLNSFSPPYRPATRSIMLRIEQFELAVSTLQVHTIFGVGFGYITSVNTNPIHNSFILMATALGSIGGLLWILVFVLISIRLVSLATSSGLDSPDGAMAATLSAGLTGILVELNLYPGFNDFTAVATGVSLAGLALVSNSE